MIHSQLVSSLPPESAWKLGLNRLSQIAAEKGTTGRPRLPDTHPGQDEVLASSARYRVLCCGRRWRKSTTGMIALIRAAEAKRDGRYWWVWPTFTVGYAGWDMLRHTLGGQAEISEGHRRVTLSNGSEIWVKSADNEDSLRGAGLDGVIFDECRWIAERAWTSVIRPALTDRRGWAMFASTPMGYDWFYRLYVRGHDRLESDWQSWQFPTGDNPSIDPQEIEAARATMTEREFRQEMLAEFVESAGGVFRNVRQRALGELRQPGDRPGAAVVIGADWGKVSDFSVFVALDCDSRQVVDFERMNRVDYHLQAGRLAAMYERWQALMIVPETNAMGEPVIEQLERMGLRLMPFTTTAASKPPLIESLSVAIERGEITFPNIPELVMELEAYEMRPSGATHRPVYGAPSGAHDDCVMALALAWHGAQMRPAQRGALAAANPGETSRFVETAPSGGRWGRDKAAGHRRRQ